MDQRSRSSKPPFPASMYCFLVVGPCRHLIEFRVAEFFHILDKSERFPSHGYLNGSLPRRRSPSCFRGGGRDDSAARHRPGRFHRANLGDRPSPRSGGFGHLVDEHRGFRSPQNRQRRRSRGQVVARHQLSHLGGHRRRIRRQDARDLLDALRRGGDPADLPSRGTRQRRRNR